MLPVTKRHPFTATVFLIISGKYHLRIATCKITGFGLSTKTKKPKIFVLSFCVLLPWFGY